MSRAQSVRAANPFEPAREKFDHLIDQLERPEAQVLDHAQLERLIEKDGMEVLRLLLQGHIDLRGPGDVGPVVVADGGVEHTHKRTRSRGLMSVFGLVMLSRIIYGTREAERRGLAPLDASLNLPGDRYSHGVRRRIAEQVARGSYDEATKALGRTTGAAVPKRQAEELAARAAMDFDDFYAERGVDTDAQNTGGVLVITVDGKGIVMRLDALLEQTRKAAEREKHKLRRRLTKGEKANRKRMATVASVYTIEPDVRTPDVIVGDLRGGRPTAPRKRPKPHRKRVWASVAKTPAAVIDEAFAEALRRDPRQSKRWVAVVDGNKTQIRLLRENAKRRGIELTIILDVIHVTEYMWRAARAFYAETDPAGEAWVDERFLRILEGKSSNVAAGMRRSATKRQLDAEKRRPVDKCADYLLKYGALLHYDEYLAAGLPIASGVIEGACRHLVKDRMDITGARWTVEGAEAVLRLRALRASGDFDAYWAFHEDRERASNHEIRYGGHEPPSIPVLRPDGRPVLRLVRS